MSLKVEVEAILLRRAADRIWELSAFRQENAKDRELVDALHGAAASAEPSRRRLAIVWRAFITDPKEIVLAAIQLATDREPWADVVYCSPEDYQAAPLPGNEYRIPVPRQPVGSAAAFKTFSNPTSPGRISEEAESFLRSTHVFTLRPERGVERGRLEVRPAPPWA